MIYNYRSLVLGVYLLLNICFNSYCSSINVNNQTLNTNTIESTQTTPPTQDSQQNCIKSFIKENIDFILHKVFCKEYSPGEKKIYNRRNIKRWYDLYLNHYDDIYIRKYRFLDFLYRYLNIIHIEKDEMRITREIHLLTSFIFQAFLYRGLGGTKQFSSKYNFIGCDWYFGIGNVPYVGGFFTLAFVCKPTKYLPPFLQDKVTIHIIDFKPFYFLITYFLQREYRRVDGYSSLGVVEFAISKVKKNSYIYDVKADLILHPSLYLGLFVVQVKITEYYDISVNLFGWLLGKLVYKLLEARNKFIKHKKKI